MADDWSLPTSSKDNAKDFDRDWFSMSPQPGPSSQLAPSTSNEVNFCHENTALPADLEEIEPSNFDSDSHSSLHTLNVHGSQLGETSPNYQDHHATVSPVASKLNQLFLNSPPIDQIQAPPAHWPFAPLSVQSTSSNFESSTVKWSQSNVSGYIQSIPDSQQISPNRLTRHSSLPGNYASGNAQQFTSANPHQNPAQPTFISSWPCTPMQQSSYYQSTLQSPLMPQLLESPQTAPGNLMFNRVAPSWPDHAQDFHQQVGQSQGNLLTFVRPPAQFPSHPSNLTSPPHQQNNLTSPVQTILMSPPHQQSPERKPSYPSNLTSPVQTILMSPPQQQNPERKASYPSNLTSPVHQQSPERKPSYPINQVPSNIYNPGSSIFPPHGSGFFPSPMNLNFQQQNTYLQQFGPSSSASSFFSSCPVFPAQVSTNPAVNALTELNHLQMKVNADPSQISPKRRYIKTAPLAKQLVQREVDVSQPGPSRQRPRGRPPGQGIQKQRSVEPKIDTSNFTPEQLEAYELEVKEKKRIKAREASKKCADGRLQRIETLKIEIEMEKERSRFLGNEITKLQWEVSQMQVEFQRHKNCSEK